MATIKEIAEMAGVSRGTVDRVLNNRSGVNEETARKIRAIMKQVNYHPNMAGIALAAQKNKYLVGIIVFSRTNPFFDDVIAGFTQKASELAFYGCETTIKRVAYNPDAQLSAIESCINEGIQGLIITPYNDERICKELNALTKKGIPVITVNSDAENVNRLTYVGSNYYNSGMAAGALMQHMTNGKVNLGIILGDSNILCHTQRHSGFAEKIHGDDRFNIITCAENNDDDSRSYEIVSKIVKEHPEINGYYFTAAGVSGGCKAIMEFAKDKELCIITHDDVPSTIELLQKGIITATICQKPKWQGAKSLELMFSYLCNPTDAQIETNYFSETYIKIRETV